MLRIQAETTLPRRRAVLHALCTLLAWLAFASPATAQNDLAPLSDEFTHPATLAAWTRLHVTEQWNADQLETWDIATTTPGQMTMIPETVVWFGDYVGPLAYKLVSGDFALTTWVRATGRDGVSRPAVDFSLAGLMLRAPVTRTPATWTPGHENYVFLSLGFGTGNPPGWQHEVKTTVNGQSTLILSDAAGPEAGLQLVRVGEYVLTLRRAPGGAWVVHRRYRRADFPSELQAGFVTYTDWTKCQPFAPFVHNQTVLQPPLPPGVTDPRPDLPFAPDLTASFDHARFHRVTLPAALVGADLTNASAVPDTSLLEFLGGHLDDETPVLSVATLRASPLTLAIAPNPGWGAVNARFVLAEAANPRLEVFDVSGARVRDLVAGALAAGPHVVRWDGAGPDGQAMRPGVYIMRLSAGAHRAQARAVWLGR